MILKRYKILSMSTVDIIIEIPYNSFVKYEYDKTEQKMRCDRVLHTAMAYPGNYGYIPNTLSGDGDPLDVLMICEYPIYPGTIVKARMVGVLFTKDEKGDDEKIIAVPSLADITKFSLHKRIKILLYCICNISNHKLNFSKHKFSLEISKFYSETDIVELKFLVCEKNTTFSFMVLL